MALKTKFTKKQQNNIAAAVFLIGFALFAYVKWGLSPLVKKYNEKVKVMEQKQQELKDARNMVASYSAFKQESTEIRKRVDFINKRLPKEVNISETIRELTRKATESNINIIHFQPGKESDKSGYKEIELLVSFETNYRSLGDFLTNIGYIERLTVPSNLKISAINLSDKEKTGSGRKNIKVDMSVNIFSFLE